MAVRLPWCGNLKAYAPPALVVQRSRNPEEERARLGGAAEPAQLLWKFKDVDPPRGRHTRGATGGDRGLGVKKFGLQRDRGWLAVAIAEPGCSVLAETGAQVFGGVGAPLREPSRPPHGDRLARDRVEIETMAKMKPQS